MLDYMFDLPSNQEAKEINISYEEAKEKLEHIKFKGIKAA
jgi:hypothetical protein